jgi:hypothetical protein
MQTSNVENDFKKHLIGQHMMFTGPTLIEERLRKLMGKTRYEGYLDACDKFHEGFVSVDALYHEVESLEEANALISHQAPATLAVGAALYDASGPHLFSAARVCDLGCYTGGFTSWFAKRHPECRIVGIDRELHLLDIASRACNLPNHTYRLWDYTNPPTLSGEFDVLLSCFGVDLRQGDRSAHQSLDPYNRRSAKGYQEIRQGIEGILANWRAAAKTRARLIASLRIPDIDAYLAVIDSAAAAGWEFSLNDSRKVAAEEEVFPILSFCASEPQGLPNEDDILQWSMARDTALLSAVYSTPQRKRSTVQWL